MIQTFLFSLITSTPLSLAKTVTLPFHGPFTGKLAGRFSTESLLFHVYSNYTISYDKITSTSNKCNMTGNQTYPLQTAIPSRRR